MLAQINQLNNSPALIYAGQELIIAVPQGVPAATPTVPARTAAPTATKSGGQAVAVATAEQPTAPAEAPSSAEASASSTLCVSAYNDRNRDGMHDSTTEELLADAVFTLSSETGVVGSHTSDGVSEPYCFTQLIAGTYMVQLTKPTGYDTTTPEYWAVPLPSGATANVAFGHQRNANASPPSETSQAVAAAETEAGEVDELLKSAAEESTESTDKSESKSLLSSLGEIAVGVGGIFVLLLAAAVGVAFVASRRKA